MEKMISNRYANRTFQRHQKVLAIAACCVAVLLALAGLTGCSSDTSGEEVKKQTLKVAVDYSDCDPNGGGDMTDGSMGAENTIDETKEIDGVTYNWGKDPIFTYEAIYDGSWNLTEGTTQRKMYEDWKSKGSENEDGLAKYDGRYVIATGTKYGKPGDKIDFIYKDGSKLQCIIGDQKSPSDSNGSEWGHLYPDGPNINFIEFIMCSKPSDNPGTSGFHPEFKKDIVGWSTQSTDSTSGDTEAQDDREAAGTNRTSSSGYSMEKDGHKIPQNLDEQGNPQGEDSRGKGKFGIEIHMTNALKSGEEHDMSKPGADSQPLVNDEGQPENSPFGANYTSIEEVYYINMRWEYCPWTSNGRQWAQGVGMSAGHADSEAMSWTGKQKVLIKNDKTGKELIAAVIETGPQPSGIIGGLSPEAMYYLTDGHEQNEPDYMGMTVLGWMNDENATPGPTTGNEEQDAKEQACNSGSGDDSVGSGLQGAIAWGKMIAEDDAVGYGQTGYEKDRNSVKDYQKGSGDKYNVDCSALVYWSLVKGGGFTKIKEQCGDYAFSTDNEPQVLQQAGFEEHDINDGELKAGDVLWKDGHTELYAGDGKTDGAHAPEGSGVNGQPGDQGRSNGREEVSYSDYDNKYSGFTKYYRYTGPDTGGGEDTDSANTSADSSTSSDSGSSSTDTEDTSSTDEQD